MRQAIAFLTVFVLLLVGPALFRYLSFYQLGGASDRGDIPVYDPAAVVSPEATPPSTAFVDEPTLGKGVILLDVAHANAFSVDELGYFHGRLAARGFELLYYDGTDLASYLRSATAFVVITPLETFSSEEVTAVKSFVNQGGRLLLLGDPTRFNVGFTESLFEMSYFIEDDQIPLNSLAAAFDLTFNGDYLYNQSENEGNFRNIILRGNSLGDSPLTDELDQLVFYGSHSIDVGSSATAVLRGGDDTWSSATDRPGGLTLAASSHDGRVLALGDIHFLTEPYYTSYDNGRFIAHIADFLTATDGREYGLLDFPYFYKEEVALSYMGLSQLSPFIFEQTVALQKGFSAAGYTLNLTAVATPEQDSLWLGLYNQADEQLVDILASHHISFTIDPPILPTNTDDPEGSKAVATATAVAAAEESNIRLIHTPLGDVPMSGTAVFLLNQQDGQNQLIVLAASNNGLTNMIDFLLDLIPFNTNYEAAGCLVQNNLALCPTAITDEEVEAELILSETSSSSASNDDDDEDDASEPDTEDDDLTTDIDLDATEQGVISLGETIEGELGEAESHLWLFDEGPATVDIILQGEDALDSILELYDSAYELIDLADSSFSGGEEALFNIELDSGTYYIVVRDYYASGGTYTLTVSEAGENSDASSQNGPIENIFLFIQDDGQPIGQGFTSADRFVELLSTHYELTVWSSSIDGPLEEDAQQLLSDADLLIWDSGDFLIETYEDTFVVYDYLAAGGPVLMTGSAPAMLTGTDLTQLVDIELTSEDPILLDGLENNQTYSLDGVYEVSQATDDIWEDSDDIIMSPFLLYGPDSANSGQILGTGIIDLEFEQIAILLALPFVLLPEELQEPLLTNILIWFEENSF